MGACQTMLDNISNIDNNITGKRLRELRKKHNLYQEDVGNAIGVVKSSIAQYEKGQRNPKKSSLPKLAELFNTSVDYILGITDNSEAPKSLDEPTDLKKFMDDLKDKDFNYDGKKLDNKDLDLITTIFERIVNEK